MRNILQERQLQRGTLRLMDFQKCVVLELSVRFQVSSRGSIFTIIAKVCKLEAMEVLLID